MINLNISGVVAMGLVCIPFMKKNSHIINIASQASFQPVPYQNVYSATKSFVKNSKRPEIIIQSLFRGSSYRNKFKIINGIRQKLINENIEIVNKILPVQFLDFEKGLPNENFPSDHLYLFTEFKFCDKSKEIPYDYNSVIYDRNLNYSVSIPNPNKNNNNKYEKKLDNNITNTNDNNNYNKKEENKINNKEDNKDNNNNNINSDIKENENFVNENKDITDENK